MNKVRTRRRNISKNKNKRNTRNNRKRKVSIKKRRVKSKRRISSLKGGMFKCGSRPGEIARPKGQGFMELGAKDKKQDLAEVKRKIKAANERSINTGVFRTNTKQNYANFIKWLDDNEPIELAKYDVQLSDEISKMFAEKKEWAEYKLQQAIDQGGLSLY